MKYFFIKENFKHNYSSIVTMNNLFLKLVNLNILNINNKNIIEVYDLNINQNLTDIFFNISEFDLPLISNTTLIGHKLTFFEILEKINSVNVSALRIIAKQKENNKFFKNIINFININYETIKFKKLSLDEIIQNRLLVKLFLQSFNDFINDLKTIEISDDLIKIINDKLNTNYTTIDDIFNFQLKFNSNFELITNLLIIFNNLDNKKIFYNQYYLYLIIDYYNYNNKNNIFFSEILYKLIIFIHVLKELKYINGLININKLELLQKLNNFSNEHQYSSNSDISIILNFHKNIKSKINLFINNQLTIIFSLFFESDTNIGNILVYFDILKAGIPDFTDNFITPILIFDNNILNNHFEDIEISIENINDEKELLLNNPSYIFNNYLSKKNFDKLSLFLKLNINYIHNNKTIKSNLLKYFLKLYIENKESNNILNVMICLIHIQLLIFKCHSDIDIKKYGNLSIYNYFQIYVPEINIEMLDEILYKIYQLNNYEIDNFINYIDQNFNEFKSINNILDMYCLKFNLQFTRENIKFININNTIKTLFNIKADSIIFLYDDCVYIINFENVIKLILDKNNFIINIYFNNNKVIKYNEINEPFVNFIPTNCFHLIYLKNEQYHITYFINNDLQLELKSNILNELQFNNKIITIRISKQNNFLPISEDIKQFIILINNFGYNSLNSILVNEESQYGYIINNNELQLIKSKFLIKFNAKVEFDNNDFKLKNEELQIDSSFEIYLSKINKELQKNYIKLMKKISFFEFKEPPEIINKRKEEINNYILEKLNKTKVKLNTLINIYDDVDELLNYITFSKIVKFFDEIKISTDLQSTIKIYGELFENRKNKFQYLFEYLFEFIYGYEILDEQFVKYREIISNFVNLEQNEYMNEREDKLHTLYDIKYNLSDNQFGGTFKEYNESKIRIDKFMMGKGKSAVLTPLLALYFSIIHQKTVYIIVPQHLKKQTEKTMNQYIIFFQLLNKIIIMSDTEIKYLHLYEKANEQCKKNLYKETLNHHEIETDSIFLIDEIDTILDPSSSNYNIKLKIGSKIDDDIFFQILNCFSDTSPYTSDTNASSNIFREIEDIKYQLDNNILKENINWGIHDVNGYAIPFSGKSKPDLNSTFSSIIMTIYLTLYFHIIINKYKLSNQINDFIIHHNVLLDLFNKNIILPNKSDIIEVYNEEEKSNESKLKILKNIVDNIKLTKTQLNVSFIDILIRPNIYKIGYSGTLKINYPKINKPMDNTNYDIQNDYNLYDDFDEIINIKYAITNQNTKIINGNIFDEDIKYDAYIDICGLYKNQSNEDFALFLFEKFNRPIIFIDEHDIIKIILNEKSISIYIDDDLEQIPIFYYDQGHIIGIDIKQEKYPKLKGLCIIDSNTKYKDIAQGIFILRKINFGHSIDIYCEQFNNKQILFEHLVKNDELNVINNKSLLDFQTYKAITRMNNDKDNVNHPNFEHVKYYFIDNINLENSSQTNLLENICNVDEKLLSFYELTLDSLYKIIYNFDISNVQTEIEQETKVQSQIENQKIFDINSLKTTGINFTDILLKPNIEYYSNFDEKSIMIKYQENIDNNDIYFLPNIFTFNLSGLAFILIKNKLLLVPGHMIKIFIKLYPIFNIYLKQINNIDFEEDNIETIKNKYILFEIILKYNVNEFDKLNYECIYLLFIILINDQTNINFQNIFTKTLNVIKENKYTYPSTFIKNVELDNLKQIICDLSSYSYSHGNYILVFKTSNIHEYNFGIFESKRSSISESTLVKNKYLKYKIKYLKKKNYLTQKLY